MVLMFQITRLGENDEGRKTVPWDRNIGSKSPLLDCQDSILYNSRFLHMRASFDARNFHNLTMFKVTFLSTKY